jgi:tetratricopeptide (TPR) repeat protein
VIEFDYGWLSVTSTPPEAQIFNGTKRLGVTPTTFALPPGSYSLDIVKEGFASKNVSVTFTGNTTNALTVKLPNLAFLQAMERARTELAAFNVNYERALTEVENALQIEPEAEEPRTLKRTVQFNQYLIRSKQFAANGVYAKALADINAALKLNPDHNEALALRSEWEKAKQEADRIAAEARRTHPEEVFRETAVRLQLQYHDLFQSQTMRFSNSLDKVHAGILRALAREPAWVVSSDNKPDEETVVMQGQIKSVGGRKNLFLVAGQTADNEVAIYFKLIELTLDTKILLNLNGLREESYIPLHPQHVSAVRAPFVEKQRTTSLQDFKKRIENELH